MSEGKFIIKHLTAKEINDPRVLKEVHCWRVFHSDMGGHTENEYEFTLHKDGTICIADDYQWVFVRGDAIDLLRKFLNGDVE